MALGHAGPGAVLEKWCPAPVRKLSSGSDTTPPVSVKHLTLNHSFMLVPSGRFCLLLFTTAQAVLYIYICIYIYLLYRRTSCSTHIFLYLLSSRCCWTFQDISGPVTCGNNVLDECIHLALLDRNSSSLSIITEATAESYST